MLRPKSVAVLGGRWADTVVDQCGKLGFQGPIHRVHPHRDGAFHSLRDLPEVPDAVFVGVNRHATIDVLAEMRRIGAGGAVCMASGFSELGTSEGDALTESLAEAAGEMPFIGPNCYGIVNFFDGIALFPDQVRVERPERGIAMIAQSGTIGCNVMYSDRALPLGYLWTIGNQTGVRLHDLILAAIQDPRVSAIGIYADGIKQLPEFAHAIASARAQNVPVAIFKSGRSFAAKRAVLSHTGAMAGEERYFDALFRRLGVARCETLSELIETLKLLHTAGPLKTNQIVPMGASGGDMAMAADVLDPVDLTLPDIPAETAAELKRQLGVHVTISNPFDFQTFNWHDPVAMRAMFATLMQGSDAAFAFLADHPDPKIFDASLFAGAARAFCEAVRETGAAAMTISSMPESNREAMRDLALGHGVTPLQGMADAFRAIAHAAWIGRTGNARLLPSLDSRDLCGSICSLSEHDAKCLLAKAGIPVPRGIEVAISAAPEVADQVGYPVVMKASSSGLSHKTEAGGVRLNLTDAQAVESAARDLARISGKVLIEEMITDAVAELIIGVDVDPAFGPVILIGAGGILAELLNDTVVLLPPFTREDVETALQSLRINRVLEGYRGRKKADIAAVIDVVMSIGGFATECETLCELDINPLIVRPEGLGAIAADALVRKLERSDRS